MDIYTLLIIGHIVGTILGVGAATFIEVHLNMALADGKMEPTEKAVMGKDFLISRIGLALCFVTGLGFIWLYVSHNQMHRLQDGVFLAKMAIIAILVLNAYLLHKHKIGLYWGSAFSFVSWWAAMLLGTFLTNNVKFFPGQNFVSFFTIMVVYGVVVVAGAWILHQIRNMTKQSPNPAPVVSAQTPAPQNTQEAPK